MSAHRRCDIELATIRAMALGDRAWLNTLGEQDWELEKSFHLEDYTMNDLNYYRDLCHTANISWWPEDKKTRNQGQLLSLCVSELSEALEGHRKSGMDDHLPHRKMLEVELIDFLIRAFDMAGGMDWDLTDPDIVVISGNTLDEIALRCSAITAPAEEFADTLMRITGFLVDCYRYRDFSEKQAGNLKRAVQLALALGHGLGHEIQKTFDEKMAYNRVRADHQKAHRAAEGGKKY